MDEIRIDNLEVYAYHGVLLEENRKGQSFFVNMVLYTDTREAGKQDELTLSTNYSEVCHFVTKYMQEHTVSKEDIEALFTDDTIVLDCGDASSHAAEKTPDSSADTISLAGARTIVEELAKRLPKVEWGEF